jgi:hypothetical protein
VRRLRSSLFGGFELRVCSEPASGCSFRSPEGHLPSNGGLVRCLPVDRRDLVLELLRGAVTQDDDMQTLRSLVAGEVRAVSWLSNHQVIERIAETVVRRHLCLLVTDVPMTGAASTVSVAPRPPLPSMGITPSALKSRPDADISAATMPEIAELTKSMNQALQAATLQEAARRGTPFCEVCEKARQEREHVATGT